MPMLRQTTVLLHAGHMKKLKVLAEAQGLKTAQLLRLAVSAYLKRHAQLRRHQCQLTSSDHRTQN